MTSPMITKALPSLRECDPLSDRSSRSLILVGFTVCYFAITSILSYKKLLWTDELYTFYIATRPSLRDVWEALRDGPDLSPPLSHFVTRAAIAVFGDSCLVVRLPAMIGYWLMSVCIFLSARLWCRNSYALIAMLFPVSTLAFAYAYEARPYGLLLGFSAAALTCWQYAGRCSIKLPFLIGMAACLAASLATHWYGVLVFLPIMAGELVRSIINRRIDWSVWAAIGLGAIVLFGIAPLTKNATSTSNLWNSAVTFHSVYSLFESILAASTTLTLISLGIGALLPTGATSKAAPLSEPKPPLHEVIAVATTAMLPLLGGILAAMLTGIVLPRYVVPSVIGVSLLFGLSLERIAKGNRIANIALVIVALSVSCLSVRMAKVALVERSSVERKIGRFALLRLAESDDTLRTIAVVDHHSYMQLRFYAPKEVASRLVFVPGINPLEEKLSYQLERWGHVRVETLDELVNSKNPFYLYEDTEKTILPALLSKDATLSSVNITALMGEFPQSGKLYLVKMK